MLGCLSEWNAGDWAIWSLGQSLLSGSSEERFPSKNLRHVRAALPEERLHEVLCLKNCTIKKKKRPGSLATEENLVHLIYTKGKCCQSFFGSANKNVNTVYTHWVDRKWWWSAASACWTCDFKWHLILHYILYLRFVFLVLGKVSEEIN